jgi:hypothetical protein
MSRSYKKAIPYRRKSMSWKPHRGKHGKKKKLIPDDWDFKNISQMERDRKTTRKFPKQSVEKELKD